MILSFPPYFLPHLSKTAWPQIRSQFPQLSFSPLVISRSIISPPCNKLLRSKLWVSFLLPSFYSFLTSHTSECFVTSVILKERPKRMGRSPGFHLEAVSTVLPSLVSLGYLGISSWPPRRPGHQAASALKPGDPWCKPPKQSQNQPHFLHMMVVGSCVPWSKK